MSRRSGFVAGPDSAFLASEHFVGAAPRRENAHPPPRKVRHSHGFGPERLRFDRSGRSQRRCGRTRPRQNTAAPSLASLAVMLFDAAIQNLAEIRRNIVSLDFVELAQAFSKPPHAWLNAPQICVEAALQWATTNPIEGETIPTPARHFNSSVRPRGAATSRTKRVRKRPTCLCFTEVAQDWPTLARCWPNSARI